MLFNLVGMPLHLSWKKLLHNINQNISEFTSFYLLTWKKSKIKGPEQEMLYLQGPVSELVPSAYSGNQKLNKK